MENGFYEIKQYLSYEYLLDIKSQLLNNLEKDDTNSDSNHYNLKVLVFESNDEKSKGKIKGIDNYEQFSLKVYNNDYSQVILEKKTKRNNKYFVEEAYITEKECKKIMNNDIEFIKEIGSYLLFELYIKMNYQNLVLKKVVSLQRDSFKHKDTKIYLDYDIRTSSNINDFFLDNFKGISLPHYCILKVKYPDYFPEIGRAHV